jgi:hypothetical protein
VGAAVGMVVVLLVVAEARAATTAREARQETCAR